jgi:EAL domain-containing protein (putative c-di-GMP-specific phosphodiesterase class I)
VRWQHPERGLLAPDAFIGVAEETGLIVDLGRHVLRCACEDVVRWRAAVPGARDLGLSVNVSARQLAHPGFFEEVVEILERSEMPAHALALEITEGVLITGGGTTAATIDALRAIGVRIMLDDFGTGYSSLSYLRRFPLDVLKIDRSFVTTVHESIESRAVVEAITTMAHALGIDVTAEGVETVEQLHALRELGCASVQGYLLSRPMLAGPLEASLRCLA